jgi:hypothetical protein
MKSLFLTTLMAAVPTFAFANQLTLSMKARTQTEKKLFQYLRFTKIFRAGVSIKVSESSLASPLFSLTLI